MNNGVTAVMLEHSKASNLNQDIRGRWGEDCDIDTNQNTLLIVVIVKHRIRNGLPVIFLVHANDNSGKLSQISATCDKIKNK